jgi:hypothetical protein
MTKSGASSLARSTMFAAVRQLAMLRFNDAPAPISSDMTHEGYEMSQCGREDCGGFILVREGEREQARERERRSKKEERKGQVKERIMPRVSRGEHVAASSQRFWRN